MPFFRIGNQGLAVGAASLPRLVDLSPPAPSGLTLQLEAEYIDSSGNLQTATADADTTPTISGVAPFAVWFDATGSRSEATNADDEAGAFMYMNFRFDTGEGISGNWSISGLPRNRIEGAPLMGHVFTVPGTHTFTLTGRDSEGRQGSITMTVEVAAPSAGTDIAEGGSWPTWADNTVYNLAAGTDHTAKGAINLNGRSNVLIRKTGTGADPIVTALNWDTRNVVSTVASRTRACRVDGINVGQFSDASIGPLYCSVLNHSGSFSYETGSPGYYWTSVATTENEKNNIRYPRGMFFWNCASITSGSTNYVFIWAAKRITFRNCMLDKTSGTNSQHILRGSFADLDLRGNLLRATAQTMSYVKLQGFPNGSTFDEWPPDDRVGLFGGARYWPVQRFLAVEYNTFGAAGANNTTGTNIEIMPENDDAGSPDEASELASVQGNRWYLSATTGLQPAFSGRYFVYSDNKTSMGAGAEVGYSTNHRLNRTPPGWEGPYLNAARPAFED